MAERTPYIRWFDDLDNEDVGTVGGKNASLGEMIQTLKEEGIRVPDGFSVGSNDLTQLVLGVSRDEDRLADLFDERRPSVKRMIAELIERAHAAGRPVGICGQAPSDYPDFTAFLVEAGIDSISLNPDSVLDVIKHVAEGRAVPA